MPVLCLCWLQIADKYGRFRASVLIGLFVALMGIASAFSVNFIMLIALRALTGVGIGGGCVWWYLVLFIHYYYY